MVDIEGKVRCDRCGAIIGERLDGTITIQCHKCGEKATYSTDSLLTIKEFAFTIRSK